MEGEKGTGSLVDQQTGELGSEHKSLNTRIEI